MGGTAFQIVRICLVIALVCFAAALATPKDRLPLALRGLARLLHQDAGAARSAPSRTDAAEPVPFAKRLFAFVLVLVAGLVALL